MKKITVEVWSDFVCPWCWIAKRRLEKAVAALAGQVEVEIVPRAYRLAKGMRPLPIREVLLQKTGSMGEAEAFMQAVRESASLESLDYKFDSMLFGDTTAAHQYVKAISDPVLQANYVERLFMAGTTEGKDIFDESVLRHLARDVGATDIDGLDSTEASIRSDEAVVKGLSVGVPLFVINGKHYISGAQDAAVFAKGLIAAVEDLSRNEEEIGAASCSSSGCSH